MAYCPELIMVRSAIARMAKHSLFQSRKQNRRKRGATAVEMAFVAPMIFLIVLSSLEFSRVIMVKQALTNAAREGCRTGSLATTQSTSDVEDAARYYLRRCLVDHDDTNIVRITITPANVSNIESGAEITTEIEVNFSDVSWLGILWVGDAKLVGTAKMKRE